MATAAVVAVAITATVASSTIQSRQASKAAKAQRKQQKKALEAQEAQQARTRADVQPFVETGTRALNTLTGTATPFNQVAVNGQLPEGTDPNTVGLPTFQDTEFFDFQAREGERSIDRFLASRGRFFSGVAAQQQSDFISKLTGEEAQRERARLERLAGNGQNAALNLGSLEQNNTNQQAAARTRIGAVNANNAIAQGDIIGGAVNQTGGIVASEIRREDQNQRDLERSLIPTR